MAGGRPVETLTLSDEERSYLERQVRRLRVSCQRRTKNALLGRSKNASLVIERGPQRGPSLNCGLSDLGCVL